MGRIFRLQPVARVGLIGRLDTPTLALRRLGPVEDARQTLQGASSPEGLREGGQCGHLQPKGTVATEFGGRPAPGLHPQTLPRSWTVFHGDAGGRLTAEPPWYGPVCPVVWEGRHREMPPYPD